MAEAGLWALFASAFVSATLFPGGSEAVLFLLARDPAHGYWQLLLVATLGNTLGGMTTWGLGRILAWRLPHETLRRESQRRAVDRLRRWGAPGLLLSWVPVIGDPLCFAAGWLRISPLVAFGCIGAGKLLRYVVVMAAAR